MKLYIIATPIGNLKDISFRAIEILKSVDLILCEDTRQTSKLCVYYQIKKPLLSYHQHSKFSRVNQIFKLLEQGKDLALVSDAGTPGISDPGNKLIELVLKRFGPMGPPAQAGDLAIVPIPGPCALIAGLSVCGFPTDKFIFLGFCPQKKGRKIFFQQIIQTKYTVVFYESCYRILKTLGELSAYSELNNQEIFIGRELTKKFETIYRGRIKNIIEELKNGLVKGEFVVIINNYNKLTI